MSNRLCFLISESDGCQSAQRRFIKISLRDKSSISEATDLVCGLFNKTALEINTSICEFPLENFEVKSEITTQRCEVCDLTICGRDSYDAHTKSKRHKGAIKRREAEKRFLERFGTPLPPKKRERVDL
ncbi:Zinc-finger of C2H2 type, putative [Angomonas deanei]|uniref:Zinc-finger of C2H2 type, putative n=1 Tax=Angomonas deanei TaxID=59799 RepID=A0A7G2CHE0_9TRYP|nr:Zinc-finger of C2H2 type, putative [Angomonas deanei]